MQFIAINCTDCSCCCCSWVGKFR